MKKEDKSLSYLKENKGFLYRASRNAEQVKYNDLYDNYTFTNDALYYNALKIAPYPWQNFERVDIQIRNIYTIHTPAIDSFLTGTLVAASSALIIYQGMYKDKYIPLPDF
jgi:hypothetical protein